MSITSSTLHEEEIILNEYSGTVTKFEIGWSKVRNSLLKKLEVNFDVLS